MARAVGSEPTPEAATVMAEEYRRLLDALDDPTLKKVAVWRMEGYTEDAIPPARAARRTIALVRPDPYNLARRRFLKSLGTPHSQADMSLSEPIGLAGDSHEQRPSPRPGGTQVALARLVDAICRRFEASWRAGRRPAIGDYLGEVADFERVAKFSGITMSP